MPLQEAAKEMVLELFADRVDFLEQRARVLRFLLLLARAAAASQDGLQFHLAFERVCSSVMVDNSTEPDLSAVGIN